MSTKQDAPTIGQLLRNKRGDRYQTVVADEIGVSRQSYRQWEDDFAVPGDEWVEPLMAHLGMEELDVVVTLYRSRLAKNRISVLGLVTHRPLLRVA